jgi:hypothetical protein
MNHDQGPRREDLITVKEASEVYAMGESTAWLLIKRHDLDRYRVPGQGKRTFIRRDDFEQAYHTPVPVGEPSKKAAA